VKVTEQLADPPVPESSHTLWLKTPGLLEAKPTPPMGVGWPPAATVTVHVVGAPAATGLGEQLTLVDGERFVTATV
jgi:hypothetical protein